MRDVEVSHVVMRNAASLIPLDILDFEATIEPAILGPEAPNSDKRPGLPQMILENFRRDFIGNDVKLYIGFPAINAREKTPDALARSANTVSIRKDTVALSIIFLDWQNRAFHHKNAGFEELAIGRLSFAWDALAEHFCSGIQAHFEAHGRDEDITVLRRMGLVAPRALLIGFVAFLRKPLDLMRIAARWRVGADGFQSACCDFHFVVLVLRRGAMWYGVQR